MKRLRNASNGVIAVVDDETAAHLGSEWVEVVPPSAPPVEKPAARRGRPRKTDK